MHNDQKRRVIRVLCLIVAGLLLGNAVIATVLANLSTGTFMTYALALLTAGCGFFCHKLPRWLLWVTAALLVLCVTAVGGLFVFGCHDTVTCQEDAVIVLGAGIQGETPTESLRNRLDRAAAYHAQNPDALIVVSGGQGPQESITEALAMERYLIAQGVPAAAILKEDAATSTVENFRFTNALLCDRLNADSTVAFITTDYHVFRACQAAKNGGFEAVTHCHSATPWYMVIPNGLRECAAILKFYILG